MTLLCVPLISIGLRMHSRLGGSCFRKDCFRGARTLNPAERFDPERDTMASQRGVRQEDVTTIRLRLTLAPGIHNERLKQKLRLSAIQANLAPTRQLADQSPDLEARRF